MKWIESYIDELLDYFPLNHVTMNMRTDLLQAANQDFERLQEQGKTTEEASAEIIEQIASPQTFASMIPNKRLPVYYGIAVLGLAFAGIILHYISDPDFLQFFLPARMEYPDIIERYIQYLVLTIVIHSSSYLFYRRLPQRLLNRDRRQSALFLYLGTILSALYFAVSIAFIWYSFNGYNSSSLEAHFFSRFLYRFYLCFIKKFPWMCVYAFVNAVCFLFSHQAYHLSAHPEPYQFEKIYRHPDVTSDAIEILAHQDAPAALEEYDEPIKAADQAPVEVVEQSLQEALTYQKDEIGETAEASQNVSDTPILEIVENEKEPINTASESEIKDSNETSEAFLESVEKPLEENLDASQISEINKKSDIPAPPAKPAKQTKKKKKKQPRIQVANDVRQKSKKKTNE